ncbi:Tetratricopeptide repeat protein [Rosistilla carotiformis]|uniref:Tetratricopeptide repeat protein n=1 Tax=Rosistilla carotiformis TaxID=2528017 RepID=A0A518JVD0_9BACT|nr:tetratricopeptide repeat protein [Rosistilla carotiformis]QDV69502.1 Tetratricopeptide repeat protein [Rosistilla carotiformis]
MIYDGDFERGERYLSDLLMGLPALLGCLVLTPFLLFVWSRESRLEDIYRREAKRAYDAQQHDLAVVCFDRLIRINPRLEDRFHLGLSLVAAGDQERGLRIMSGIASPEKQGFGPAHVWQAKQLMVNPEADLETITTAISHLSNAKKTLYKDSEVNYLLATCFWGTGSTERALESLRDASLQNPAYYYDLFKACQKHQLLPETNKAAELASDYLKKQVANYPLDRDARYRYVEVQIWLNVFDNAEQVLLQGSDVDPDGDWNKTLAKAYLARFRQRKSERVSLDELLTYLQKALAADPNSTDVIKELADVGIVDPSGRIEKMLEQSLTSGRHNAIVHFVLGSRRWQLNLVDDAVFHMKRAYKLDKSLGVAANNLAYYELLKEDGDLERGLDLIDELLQEFPDSHAFRETRGQLLAGLERWEEALDDLEYALPNFPNEKRLHDSLALCYDAMGQPKLASQHRKIAASIQQSN